MSFTGLSLFVAVLVGYVLARMQFKGKAFVSTLLLTTLMIPGEILLAANYKLSPVKDTVCRRLTPSA